jgi:hypothetical protein
MEYIFWDERMSVVEEVIGGMAEAELVNIRTR